MKIIGITVVSLATALVLSGMPDTGDHYKHSTTSLVKAAAENVTHLGYTFQWDDKDNSFDSAFWQAVGEISSFESLIPNNITGFSITMKNVDTSWGDIQVSFDRAGLELLENGKIASEIFMQEYVDFN